MKTIVVGYDDSEAARRALERAAELAEAFDAKLVVTSVAEPLLEPASPADPTAVLTPAPVGAQPIDTSEIHREELESAKAFLSDRAIDAAFVLERGLPAEAIVDTAEREAADLIVVGTREPGFLERLLRGSVSEGVARSARCDVLIVH